MSRERVGFQRGCRVSGASYRLETMIPVGPRSWWIIFSGRENLTAAHCLYVPQRERPVKEGRLSVEDAL
jgi:hypothetical protein